MAGLSPAAVSRQSAELIRRAMLREVPDASIPGAGKLHVPLDDGTDALVACGVHIELTHSTLALVNLRGEVVARERIAHGSRPDPDIVLAGIACRLPDFMADWRVLAIGVATGGWVDSGAGVIVEHSPARLARRPDPRGAARPDRDARPWTGTPGRWPAPNRSSAIRGPGQAWFTCSRATWSTPRSRWAASLNSVTGRRSAVGGRAPGAARSHRTMRLR
jgi:hypothetical protein